MLPVQPKPEPRRFDAQVRQKGTAWIAAKGLDPELPIPARLKIPSYWSNCTKELWSSYDGICGYSSIYIHAITGSISVEHFAPKSRVLRFAYEWTNYRLACARLNSRKREFEDVLDPFTLDANTFFMEFVTGKVYGNPASSAELNADVEKTIARLKLNDAFFRKNRVDDFDRYLDHDWSEAELKRVSPFVWYEAKRQGLLG